jgi:4-aminobutyrate aminotransferase / (S)-3-amino-2-methylpropionate transaminase / 5-aminovalerate transaminase
LDDKDLLKLEAEYCSFGDTVHYSDPPKIFRSCEGQYLYDTEGTPYFDLQMWYSASSFGYRNQRLRDAMVKQLDTLPQLACQYLHEEKILLATKIGQLAEEKFGEKGRVHFNVGGAQAVDDAIKLIRNHVGKNHVFAFMGGYHGRTLGASAITSSYRYRRRFGQFGDRAEFIPYPYCYRCYYGKKREDCGFYCVKQFEKLFETEYYGVWDAKARESEFFAFFIEAIQGTGGYVVPPPGYFKELKKVCDKFNILMVDDEIQMAWFRTGKMFAIENFGITPDVMVFGKALTNGLNPLSGIWAKEFLIAPDKFPPGSTHSTFSSNTLGTAVALENIKMMEEGNLEKTVNEKGAYYLGLLREMAKRYPVIGDVDGLGLTIRVEITTDDGFTPDRQLCDDIFEEGLHANLDYKGKKYGLILDVGGYYKNVFTLAPGFDITTEEMELSVDLFEQCLKRALKK